MGEIKSPRPVAPCKDCERRRVGCHSDCDKYTTYREENERYKTEVKKERDHFIYVGRWNDEKRRKFYKRNGGKK